MKYRTLLILLFTLICRVECEIENSHYIDLLTRGLRPPPEIPEELQYIVTKLTQTEFKDVIQLVQARDLLRSGGEDRLLDTHTSLGAPNATVSPQCINDTGQVIVGLLTGQQWALQMLDSAGKPGSGLLQFQLTFLGNYEECIGVKATQSVNNVTSQMFKGRYCKASVPFGSTPAFAYEGRSAKIAFETGPLDPFPMRSLLYDRRKPISGNAQAGLYFGLCFPDSCQGEDVTFILNSWLDRVLQGLNITISFKFGTTVCQDEDMEWDTKAVAVFVVAMVFVFLLVLGTVYDIALIQVPRWYIHSFESKSSIHGGREVRMSVSIKRQLAESAPLLDREKKTNVHRSEPSVCGKILLSFSIYTNAGKLLSTKQSAGSLTAVHGIRFLSMSWVILGHTYVFALSSIDNVTTLLPVIKRFTFQAVVNAGVSVDSFFVLSGLLVTYLVLKEMRRSGGRINWFMFYFHRFWRLTPPYMLVMMVYVPLFPYLTTGPMWPPTGVEINQCKNSWWTNLLYVNNLVRTKEMCLGWSWYLANDMQFYILSPLIFVPLFFNGVFGAISVLVFLFATMTAAGVISRIHNMQAGRVAEGLTPTNGTAGGTEGPMVYFLEYYVTPYCRMGPYIIGMVCGYFLYKTDCQIKLNKWIVLGGWCVVTGSALAVLYGLYDLNQGHTITPDVSAFYNAVHSTVWGVCLSWVVFACATGYGGFVNTLLSWPAFIPLSRLTYCVYLVHPIVMYFFYLSTRTLYHITDVTVVYWFFGHMVASYMMAFIVSMAFEAPMIGLEKALLKREKSS